MQKTTFIYALCEPGTRTVRYIGKTTNLKKRFRQHLNWSSKETTPLGDWLRSLCGGPPNLVALRGVEGDGVEAEMRYIRLAKGLGLRLTNSTDGGEGVTMTPEIREKISSRAKGRIHPPTSLETRAAISAANTGLKRSPEYCAALSASRKGKKATKETCAKMSIARCGEKNPMFGEKHTTAALAKMSGENHWAYGKKGADNPNFGNKRTFEQCAGMSEAQKGVPRPPRTEEHKAALSKAAKGVTKAPEQCAAMSKARKGVPWTPAQRAEYESRKERDQEIEWALAPYTLE